MRNPFYLPPPIEAKLAELNEIIDKYQPDLPVAVVADFLGLGAESLRSTIATGNCPFALGWQRPGAQNRAFFIPAVPFYLWYTQGVGWKN